jgi:hypothetical protein
MFLRSAKLFLSLYAAAIVCTGAGLAADGKHQHSQHARSEAPSACASLDLRCADRATPAFASNGALWLTWSAGGRVAVARSSDLGKSFEQAVIMPETSVALDNGPDARPKIAVARDGAITLAYATRDDKFNGHVLVATSRDGGTSFSVPQSLTTGSPSQRFETIAFDPTGKLFAAWIDKRNAAAARKGKETYAGAALAFAWGSEDGSGFREAAIAKDNTCECCRIAVGFVGPERPVVLFRNIFEGGVRDHGVMTFRDAVTAGPVRRVSIDDAVTDSCPHHGPSLAIDANGAYHVVWMAVGRKLKGAFYARSMDEGASFSDPLPLGSKGAQISRPFVLSGSDGLHIAWKEFDGERTTVIVITSKDNGASWGAPRRVLDTADHSDHPLLITDGSATYLSWLTSIEGYRLVSIGGAS